MAGETVAGDDTNISFSDILENFDCACFGTVEARKGPWSIFAATIYTYISNEKNASVGPSLSISTDANIQDPIFAPGVGYGISNNGQQRITGFGKLRYIAMDTAVNVSVGSGSRRFKDKFNNWDGVVGLKGVYSLSDQWTLKYYGDIGTGEADLTWQAALAG